MGLLNRLLRKDQLPSKDQFARMVTESIRRAGEKGKFVYDREQFRLLKPCEDGIRLFLGNAYQEYCTARREVRDDLLKRLARSWFVADKEPPDDFEDVKPDLLPVVRSRAYYENARLLMQIEGRNDADWPQQVVAEDAAINLVYDLPEAMRTIAASDLDRWGVTFYEALEVARDNLNRLPHGFIGPQEGEGVYLSACGDSYDASRLLCLDMIRQMKVKGDYIAMVPNRDTLIVTGSDDVDGVAGMLALAKDAVQKPRMISGLVFRLDGDEWVQWLPGDAHPSYRELRMFWVQSHGQDYNGQKDLLDQLHVKTGEDIFVASYSEMEKDDVLSSYCVWAKGTLSLLPRTDLVAFVRSEKDAKVAPWNRAVEVVGDLMQPLDIYPPRYRVEEFPTDEQLKAMGATTP